MFTRVGGPFPVVVDMADSEVRGIEGHQEQEEKGWGKTSGSLGREEGVRERLWVGEGGEGEAVGSEKGRRRRRGDQPISPVVWERDVEPLVTKNTRENVVEISLCSTPAVHTRSRRWLLCDSTPSL